MGKSTGQPPRLSRARVACVQFARFAAEHRIDPRDLAELLTLADRAFAAGERECNVKDYSADPHRERFEAKAKELRFETYWPGLLPALKRGGKTIHLPEA